MPFVLTELAPLPDLEVRTAPVGGAVWDAGALHRLVDGEVAWSRPLASVPRLAVSGRRLYVAFENVLACVDARTGADVWAEELPEAVEAVLAHREGVDALAGGAVHGFAADGRHTGSVPAPGARLARTSAGVYTGGAAGVWRLGGARPVTLSARPCVGLFPREPGIQALVDGESGTLLVEDEGLPMVWSFPDRERHLFAPYGRAEWAVAPREGRGGVWVVDRRIQRRWHVPLPGVATALAVVGSSVAVLVEDGGTALAVTHPDVSAPLLLAAEGFGALHAEGDVIYLAAPGRTHVYRLREA